MSRTSISKYTQASKPDSNASIVTASSPKSNNQLSFKQQNCSDILYFEHSLGNFCPLYNRDLVLKNQSTTHFIKFKLQCSNPANYRVYPSSCEIPPGKMISIEIQMLGVDEVAEMGINLFAKFACDKFRLRWSCMSSSERPLSSRLSNKRVGFFKNSDYFHEKIFSVSVNIVKKEEQEKRQQFTPKTKMTEIASNTLRKNKQELIRLENLILEKEIQRVDSNWLSCGVVMALTLLAILVGVALPL